MSDSPTWADWKSIVLNSELPIDERLEATRQLTVRNPEEAQVTLVILASNASEPVEMSEAAGRTLGRLMHLGVPTSEFDLRDFTDAAMDAFCEWMPGDDDPPRGAS